MLCVFFFFKQKTAYEMRISDWSSDVCSSDLCRCAHWGVRDAQAHAAGIGIDASMNSATPDIIRFDGVSYRYPGSKDVLCDVSYSIQQGEMLYVTGPSGVGKTTLLRLIAALDRTSTRLNSSH